MNEAITDVNVYLGRWPFRRLPHDEPAQLVRKLRAMRVTQAWVGSFEGIFQKDVSAVNARLSDDCRRFGEGLLVPFGTINLALPGWREDLQRCIEIHAMPGVRLHPSYHGYRLDDPRFLELAQAAAERRTILQIVIRMEDERTQHPLARAPAVDISPLKSVLASCDDLELMLLNSQRDLRASALEEIAAVGRVSADIAMLEGVGGIEQLLRVFPLERLVFGSHFPFFYFEAARLKLQESPLGEFQRRAIRTDNASRIFESVKS